VVKRHAAGREQNQWQQHADEDDGQLEIAEPVVGKT